MARKFVLTTASISFVAMCCVILTYDSMPYLAGGFSLIAAISTVFSVMVDRKNGSCIWN